MSSIKVSMLFNRKGKRTIFDKIFVSFFTSYGTSFFLCCTLKFTIYFRNIFKMALTGQKLILTTTKIVSVCLKRYRAFNLLTWFFVLPSLDLFSIYDDCLHFLIFYLLVRHLLADILYREFTHFSFLFESMYILNQRTMFDYNGNL